MQYKNIALKNNFYLECENPPIDKWIYKIRTKELTLGTLIIKNACEEKNIFLEISINSLDDKQILDIVDNIVDSLGFYLYDKEKIIIDIKNDIDLTTYNREKYKRKAVKDIGNIYIYNNKNNYYVLKPLVEAMQECAGTLLDNECYWREILSFDQASYLDKDLLPIQANIYLLEESFYSSKQVKWVLNAKNKNKRIIIFNSNGLITYQKKSNCQDCLSYLLTYNILNSKLIYQKNNLKITSTDEEYSVQKDDVLVKSDYKNNKIYQYINEGINSNLNLMIKINDELLTKFSLYFETLDKLGKSSGIYTFKIDLNGNNYMFTYTNDSEKIDLIPLLKEEDKVLLFNIKRGNLPIEKLEKTMQRLVKVINNYAKSHNLSLINYENLMPIKSILGIFDTAINDLKCIEGEIIVPIIKEKVTEFLKKKEQKEVKYATRCRSLKKEENLRK